MPLKLKAPVCKKVETEFTEFDEVRQDPYFWLREKENPEVRTYVEAENTYFNDFTKIYAEKREKIFEDLKNLVEPVEVIPPYPIGKIYWYGSTTPEGKEYPIYFRKKGEHGPEEVILDLNEIAAGKEYCSLGAFKVSPDDQILAYSIDINGSEHYTIHFKDFRSMKNLSDSIPDTVGTVGWSADSKTLFYSRLNEFERPDRVFFHRLGSDLIVDTLVHFEPDHRFFIDVSTSKDDVYILIVAQSKESSETLLIAATSPFEKPVLFLPKRENHSYSIESFNSAFLVHSNRRERNFDIFLASGPGVPDSSWKPIREGSVAIDYREMVSFKNFFALSYADKGIHKIELVGHDTKTLRTIDLPEAYYTLSIGTNLTYDRDWLRLSSRSMKSLPETFEINAFTGEKKCLHLRSIPSYNPDLYEVESFEATAADGVKIPVAVMYRKDKYKPGTPMPTILYGYGSYGIPNDARFSPTQTEACDLGFLWACAMIRGGGDLGQRWYDEGKFLKKKNTFSDFRDVALGLIKTGYSKKGDISIFGGSAGGMLVTATAQLDPALFRSVIALVPFVDVLNTMLDETLPLTPTEFDEWGNPKEEAYYHYIKSYSPYDNLKPVTYPHLLMICGWNDPRVTYWEPAKYVARARAIQKGNEVILLKTHMGSGHGGASGRFEHLKDPSELLAFAHTVHFESNKMETKTS